MDNEDIKTVLNKLLKAQNVFLCVAQFLLLISRAVFKSLFFVNTIFTSLIHSLIITQHYVISLIAAMK